MLEDTARVIRPLRVQRLPDSKRQPLVYYHVGWNRMLGVFAQLIQAEEEHRRVTGFHINVRGKGNQRMGRVRP